MKILRTLLALFLAFPAAAQVRVVPTLQGSAAPAVTLFSAPAISAPSFASPLAPALTPSLLSAPAAPQAPVAAVPVAALPARPVHGLRDINLGPAPVMGLGVSVDQVRSEKIGLALITVISAPRLQLP